MFRLKSAVVALKKRWIISILLLVQFTYGLSTLTGSINIFYNLSYLSNQSLLELKSTYLITPGPIANGLQYDKFKPEQLQQLYQKIDDNPDVISYGTYYEDLLMLDSGDPLLNRTLAAELTKISMGHTEPMISAIVIDQGYYKMLSPELRKGGELSNEDFKQDDPQIIHVLAGSFFEKFYKIGDVINGRYRIGGFLPDKYILNNNTSNLYQKLDKTMLVPMPKNTADDYRSKFTRLHLGTVLKLREGADLKSLEKMIQLPENDIPLSLKNLGEEVEQNVRSNAYIEIPQLLLGASFIIFSVIGIVVTTIASILIRKREFGIKLALGESKLGVLIQVSFENAMIASIGIGLSLTHFLWKYADLLRFSGETQYASPLDFKLNGTILLFIVLIVAIILAFSSFMVYLFIRKMEPKAMIGGIE